MYALGIVSRIAMHDKNDCMLEYSLRVEFTYTHAACRTPFNHRNENCVQPNRRDEPDNDDVAAQKSEPTPYTHTHNAFEFHITCVIYCVCQM